MGCCCPQTQRPLLPDGQRFLLEPLRDELRLREEVRDDFRDDFREGTLAPFSRASLSPIAIACFRLFTRPPEPLFSVPFFRRRIADSTLFDAALPYFAISTHLRHVIPARRVQGRVLSRP